MVTVNMASYGTKKVKYNVMVMGFVNIDDARGRTVTRLVFSETAEPNIKVGLADKEVLYSETFDASITTANISKR